MKRSTESKATKNTKATEEKTYVSIPLYPESEFKSEVINKNCTRYHMGDGVYMDICDGDDSDYGSLNLYGVVILVSYREIKKGEKKGEIFISYPQYKNKAGEYKPYVTNYSKALTSAIKTVLKAHYDGDGFMAVPSDEELPFN